jgi:hypothetical protein
VGQLQSSAAAPSDHGRSASGAGVGVLPTLVSLRRPVWRLGRVARKRVVARLGLPGSRRPLSGRARLGSDADLILPFGKHATGGPEPVRLPMSQLADALARAAGREVSSCELEWRSIAGAHGHVGARVRTAPSGGGRHTASVIVKVLRLSSEQDDREFCAYTQGLPEALPAECHMPRVFGAWQGASGFRVLLLEDVGRLPGLARSAYEWSDAMYEVAARSLSGMNAALLGHPLADAPWLLRDHIARQGARWLVGEDWTRRVREHSPLHRRLLRCCRSWDRLCRVFYALTPCLCHQDAQPANLFADLRSQRTTLIDWELAGVGVLGQDAAALVWGSWVYAGAGWLAQRERVVLNGYVAGLARHGLDVGADLRQRVRLGYLVATAACYAASIVGGGGAAVVDQVIRRWEEAAAMVL